MLMSKSRLEKFLYALYSLDSSDLPKPLSRIEDLYNCLVTGGEAPTFEPLSRVEKYLMAILGGYDVDSLPNPLSRVEVLLYKLATGDDNLDDVKSFLSEHEELLAEIIRNGGVGGSINIEYVLHALSTGYNTLYNTAEKPIKSAILKGRTLVNLVNDVTSNEVGNYSNSSCKINVIRNLQNETLTIIFNVISLEIPDGADGTLRIGGGWSGQIRCQPTLGVNKVLYNYNQTSNSWLGVFSNSGAYNLGQRITISDVMVLEGDYTNIDIPYFEGMKSVQMPVLTTTGKNLFDENRRYESSHKLWFAIPFEKDSYFTFSSFDTIPYIEFYGTTTEFIDKLYGGDGVSWNVLAAFSNKESGTFKKESKYNYIIVAFDKVNLSNGEDFLKNLQVEQGTQSTSYEPFKSNILTVDEEVELRGIGDVKDELDLITGKLTQRIGEVVLDGSDDETWGRNDILSNNYETSFFTLSVDNIKQSIGHITKICDKLPVLADYSHTKDIEGVNQVIDNQICIRILKTSLSDDSVEGLKAYLQSNPIAVQYQFITKSVKTVDLSVVNQDGNDTKLSTFNDITHVTLSSEGLIPEAELKVATKNEEDLEDSIVYTTHTLSEEFNTLYNTAEKPVKSAILKGKSKLFDSVNNEVNESNHPNIIQDYYLDVSTGQLISASTSRITEHFIECPNMPFKIRGDNKYKRIVFYDENKSFISGKEWRASANNDEVISNIPENAKYIKISFSISVDDTTTYTPSTKIELLDNDENNLYLTHLESVKMPVLKSTGKNLFNLSLFKTQSYVTEIDEHAVFVVNGGGRNISKLLGLKHKPNEQYTFVYNRERVSGNGDSLFAFFYTDGTSKNLLPNQINVSSPSKTLSHIALTYSDAGISKLSNICLVKGVDNNLIYEPFRTNILTVNEDVTLRSNGDVYDELNLLTGRLTQRIDENNEVLSQEVVKTVDLSVVDQDGNNTKLSTFDDITHVTITSEGLIPEAELEVAEKVTEVDASMLGISREQKAINTATNEQSENVDATMIATTEIYEELL